VIRPPAPQIAGILSGDARFAAFISEVHHFPGDPANFIRGWCNIASRRELATDPAARERFDQLRTAFDGWSGRIAVPR